MTNVCVSGAFDDLRSRDIRFLQEAAYLGTLTVALWSDEVVSQVRGSCKFPFEERRYFVESIRFVDRVVALPEIREDKILSPADLYGASTEAQPSGTEVDDAPVWAMLSTEVTEDKVQFCRQNGVRLVAMSQEQLEGFPLSQVVALPADQSRKRVVVTGSFDWFHSGHVRFFEECSQLGDLYAVVGHDNNIRLLKGEGHPLLCQDERLYVVASCRYVKRAMLSSGHGWMDAEPEIAHIRPHMYAVNEDGDKPEKRAFCAEHGIEYVVLRRTPKEGLPRRSSTDLRGF
jgi:cytidyltransferase-like protein